MSDHICAACGTPAKVGVIMGATYICRQCEPNIKTAIETTREEGKPVNVSHIAMKHFRTISNPQTYPFRDIPEDLWTACKHASTDERQSLRELIISALYNYKPIQDHLTS